MFIRNGGVVVEMSRAILEILRMFVEKVKECLMAATHTPRMRQEWRIPNGRDWPRTARGLDPAIASVSKVLMSIATLTQLYIICRCFDAGCNRKVK